jgi:hypothetical protein
MFVLENPGEPVPVIEDQLEEGADWSLLSARLWWHSGDVLAGKYRSDTLSKAHDEVCELLGLNKDDCLRQVMFTNIVRCTSLRKFVDGKVKKVHFDNEALTIGAKWLREEIEHWRPRGIIAYSSIARDAMSAHGIAFTAYFPHPTARGIWFNKAHRQRQLAELRKVLTP